LSALLDFVVRERARRREQYGEHLDPRPRDAGAGALHQQLRTRVWPRRHDVI
jgi:hypothetical protein